MKGTQEDAGDFLHVCYVGLHVYISSAAVNLGEVLFSLGNGRFCIDALTADHGADGIYKFRFCQHLLVYFKMEALSRPTWDTAS